MTLSISRVDQLLAITDHAELRAMLAGTAAEPFLAEGGTHLSAEMIKLELKIGV